MLVRAVNWYSGSNLKLPFIFAKTEMAVVSSSLCSPPRNWTKPAEPRWQIEYPSRLNQRKDFLGPCQQKRFRLRSRHAWPGASDLSICSIESHSTLTRVNRPSEAR